MYIQNNTSGKHHTHLGIAAMLFLVLGHHELQEPIWGAEESIGYYHKDPDQNKSCGYWYYCAEGEYDSRTWSSTGILDGLKQIRYTLPSTTEEAPYTYFSRRGRGRKYWSHFSVLEFITSDPIRSPRPPFIWGKRWRAAGHRSKSFELHYLIGFSSLFSFWGALISSMLFSTAKMLLIK